MNITNGTSWTYASYAVHMLVRLTVHPSFSEPLRETYKSALKYADKLGALKPHEWSTQDIERIQLEAFAFAVFHIILGLGKHACNHPAAGPFINPLIELVQENVTGFQYVSADPNLRELKTECIVDGVRFQEGEPFSITKRVAEYLKLYGETALPAVKRFVTRLTSLFDPREERVCKAAAAATAVVAVDRLISMVEEVCTALVSDQEAAAIARLLSGVSIDQA